MRRTLMVVLMVVAFVSGMGLRGWWESEAFAIACATPEWCEDYNTCSQVGCQPLTPRVGCISVECAICCNFQRTPFDCNGDGAPDCNDYHFTGPVCGKVRCLQLPGHPYPECTAVANCP